MQIRQGIFVLGLLALASCQSTGHKESSPAPASTAITPTPMDSSKTYDIAMVDNKKDPACGMPVTAGIGDTAHYDGKVLGFCSSECKDSFKKNPAALIAAAELKK